MSSGDCEGDAVCVYGECTPRSGGAGGGRATAGGEEPSDAGTEPGDGGAAGGNGGGTSGTAGGSTSGTAGGGTSGSAGGGMSGTAGGGMSGTAGGGMSGTAGGGMSGAAGGGSGGAAGGGSGGAAGGGPMPCTPSVECRPSAGPCDVAEICTPQGTCPPNVFVPQTQTCRASQGLCDPPERCSGDAPACPADVILAMGATCRASTGLCDPPEVCDGNSKQCPNDELRPAGALCRPQLGLCDVAETCTGSSGQCPPNLLVSAGTLCRPSVGACDVAEVCDGSDNNCPPNGFEPAGNVCAPASCSAGTATPQRACTGMQASCPAATDVSCGGYKCGGTACLTSCASDNDCIPTHYCNGASRCALKKADGALCVDGPHSCESDRCVAVGPDADGDGYTAVPLLTLVCGVHSLPGHSERNGDCCDSDARAYPTQSSYFSTPRGCGGGYDFDCNGAETKQYRVGGACTGSQSCFATDGDCSGTTGWLSLAVPACGSGAAFVASCPVVTGGGSCNNAYCGAVVQVMRTQACQ